jgi:murein DD-endopeptidase MepM/ murein hydrolase activator NlpD
MTGGFVAAVVAIALLVIVTTPEYDRPPLQVAAVGLPTPSSSPAVTADLVDDGPTSPAPTELTGYRWPLRGARVLTWFGPSKGGFIRTDDGRIHEGIDLASTCEATVTAAHKGTVKAAGRDALGEVGFDANREEIAALHRKHISRKKRDDADAKDVLPITVVVDDGNGYRSVYKHLADVAVTPGAKVKAGTVIGRTGQTGGVTRCQVQYELVRWDGEWRRVADGEIERVGYPKWIRERVDPLLVLSLDMKGAPKATRRNPPPEGSMPALEVGEASSASGGRRRDASGEADQS